MFPVKPFSCQAKTVARKFLRLLRREADLSDMTVSFVKLILRKLDLNVFGSNNLKMCN